jgi:hypothetical protein
LYSAGVATPLGSGHDFGSGCEPGRQGFGRDLELHCAAARYARLRFVPRQPRPLRQHQENYCPSLFFSSSPC